MKKTNFPTCPYCGRKLNFSKAWAIHTQTEYVCPNCSYVSEVEISNKVKRNAIIAVVVSIALILLFSLINIIKLWQIILAIIPFVVFYVNVPTSLTLEKTEQSDKKFFDDAIKEERKKKLNRKTSTQTQTDLIKKIDEATSEKTIVIPEIKKEMSNTEEVNKILKDEKLFEETSKLENMDFTALFEDIPNKK